MQTKSIWVPTLAPVAAFSAFSGHKGAIAGETLKGHMQAVHAAFSRGAYVASGSDSGAFGVAHGVGTITERKLLKDASGMDEVSFNKRLCVVNEQVKEVFVRQQVEGDDCARIHLLL